jgi:hypothetical protein
VIIDPITSLAFSVHENKGVYALLLGSGVSRAAFVPTGWEITLDLIRRVAVAGNVEDQPDWAKWYREKNRSEPSYSELLDSLSSTPDERRAILHSYIEPTPEDRDQGRKVPTKAHRAIANLVSTGFIKVIITTNFDRLMENALRDVGIEPTVVSNEDSARGAVPLPHNRCFLLKLNGDYLDTRILNTEAELAQYPPALNVLLDRIFDEYGLIVCGWSGEWDPALRSAIIGATNRRYPVFWTALTKSSDIATGIIKQRGARLLDVPSADVFFAQLAERVSLIADTRQQAPESIELAVQAAKAYVAKSEHRVQLHDLLMNEFLRTAQFRDGSDLNSEQNPQAFESVVQRYEAATEPLIRIFGVLGRHGDGSELPSVLDGLRQLAELPIVGGYPIWINLRKYPALLAAYAYCLGALKAARYDVLFRVLTLPVTVPHGNSVTLVEHVFLQQMNVNWKLLPGMGDKRVPLSEHLLARFLKWSTDYSFGLKDAEQLLDKLEILGALAYYSVRETTDAIQDAVSKDAHEKFTWAPTGRLCYLEDTRGKLLLEASTPPLSDQLLKAGFCRGDRRHLEASLKSLGNFLDYVRYVG